MDANQVKLLLSSIPDPEIPVISIVDLGVLRDVHVQGTKAIVTITPTYSGCPAMKTIEDQIRSVLFGAGFSDIVVQTVFSPAWTTDWIGEEAREKLRVYGIAPPEHSSVSKRVLMGLQERVVKCPLCASENTRMINQFGSTACKALFRCENCLEAFDYFKCI